MKFMEEVSHVDYDAKKAEITSTVKMIRAKGMIHFLFTEGLRPFIGKKVNKRAINSLKESGYTVHWERNVFGIDVSVWGCGLDYADRLYFHLHLEISECFSMEVWEDRYSYWSSSNVDRMVSAYGEMLDNLIDYVVEFNVKADTFNEVLRELKEADNNFSVSYNHGGH